MVDRKTFFTLLGIIALHSGCAHTGEKLNAELQLWIGQHPDQLVEQWGAPRSVYVMEKGAKVLTYETSETSSRTMGYYRRPEIYTLTDSCKISFYTEASQKSIERFSYSGSPAVCFDMIRSPARGQ